MISRASDQRAVRPTRWAVALLWTMCVLLGYPAPLIAERLALRTFTTADGLAHGRVKRIVWDPHGFLWLCTPRGLTRFDGSRFVSYGAEEGLPFPSVNDLLVARDGVYWIASNGAGVIRFDPTPPAGVSQLVDRQERDGRLREPRAASRFRVFAVSAEAAANRVNVLVEDRAGRVWAGTDGGLFLLHASPGQVTFSRVDLSESPGAVAVQVWALLEDAEGSLWIGSTAGLARRLPNGRTVRYLLPADEHGSRHGDASGFQQRDLSVWSLARDTHERLWIGHGMGLTVLMPEPAALLSAQALPAMSHSDVTRPSSWPLLVSRRPAYARSFSKRDGLPPGEIRALLQGHDGRLWAAGSGRLIEISGLHVRSYGPANGLTESQLLALAEDGGGNLWLGSVRDGAVRLVRGGFTGFGAPDGLGEAVTALIQSRAGELFALIRGHFLSRFDGTRFRAVCPETGPRPHPLTGSTAVLQDHVGEWWIAIGAGLFRYTKADRPEDLVTRAPRRIYAAPDLTPNSYISRLFEDSRGDIWIATFQPGRYVLTRWQRRTDRFVAYSEADGLPAFHAPWAFQEDRAGNVWVGFRDGGLARYRAGHFDVLTTRDGAPAGSVVALLLDNHGRLWVGSDKGLWYIDAPDRDRPQAFPYTAARGLTHQRILSIVDDVQGRLYLGLDRGIDRLQPSSGRVEHYTTADGLVAAENPVAYRDRHGALWLGGLGGLARLVPEPVHALPAPRVALGGLDVSGAAHPLSALGETSMSLGTLGPGENQLTISFFGPSWAPGDLLRYQYRLEGADRKWGEPTSAQDVRYAHLAPGRYRFVVRAIDSSGQVSPIPASVTFRVLPPIWRRWWFLLFAATLTSLLTVAAYRRRVAHVVELERLRTRIATDLHDDLGSTLSQIAILAEVARRRTSTGENVDESLARIAAASRASVDSMSDIVWAIDPTRDSVQDLGYRMHRLASELLAPRNITVDFVALNGGAGMSLDAELRHEVYLVYKESLTNLVRHSGATVASIRLGTTERTLVLSVGDNGNGFDRSGDPTGIGLRSMRERAHKVGGTLIVDAAAGRGTTVTLRVPLHQRPSV